MKGYKKLMDFVALVEKAVLAATMILILVLTVGNVFSQKRTFVLNWPEWIFWSFVPIGSVCMVLHFIEYCVDECAKTNAAEKNDMKKEDK